MVRGSVLSLVLLTASCGNKPPLPENFVTEAQSALTAAAETVIIGTKDGNKIFADHVPVEHARATIVLFHQAQSSGYEYAEIASKLNAMGYSTLVVDQRSGGNLFGPNRTVIKYGKSAAQYLDALPDLEAALNWARLQGQPVILWGSSYSASLALRIAADNPRLVAAVFAFSPGEYFDDKHYVRTAAAKLTMPVFITQGTEAHEIAESMPIYDAVTARQKTFFQPQKGGIHGASALRFDSNPAGAAENWHAVSQFLEKLSLPKT